jgi:hypothetical protein
MGFCCRLQAGATITEKKDMTTNQTEEAMSGHRMGLPKILLLAGMLLYAFAVLGCGSNGSTPANQQKRKSVVSAKPPQVKEILPQPHPGRAEPQEALLGQAKAGVDEEVVPPETPGGRGLTEAEVKAKAAAVKPIDPEFVEVIPPGTPGGRGLTMAEVQAAGKPIDPERIEEIPPGQPGGRGLTAAEINAARAAQ